MRRKKKDWPYLLAVIAVLAVVFTLGAVDERLNSAPRTPPAGPPLAEAAAASHSHAHARFHEGGLCAEDLTGDVLAACEQYWNAFAHAPAGDRAATRRVARLRQRYLLLLEENTP